MFIYRITNKINGKVYIGQSVRPVEQRFRRHINDAINNILDTHFARAIRYYGQENFVCEQIDTANNQDELTAKEQYWIRLYNSTECGYNETDASNKCGGNTYRNKTEDEMSVIKNKIRVTKLGNKNPNSQCVICTNMETRQTLFFDTVNECRDYFGEKHHRFITTRINGQTLCLYKGVWKIRKCNQDIDFPYTNKVVRNGRHVVLTRPDNSIIEYSSIKNMCENENFNRNIVNSYIKKTKEFEYQGYHFLIKD